MSPLRHVALEERTKCFCSLFLCYPLPGPVNVFHAAHNQPHLPSWPPAHPLSHGQSNQWNWWWWWWRFCVCTKLHASVSWAGGARWSSSSFLSFSVIIPWSSGAVPLRSGHGLSSTHGSLTLGQHLRAGWNRSAHCDYTHGLLYCHPQRLSHHLQP